MWIEAAVIIIGLKLAILAATLFLWTKINKFEAGCQAALHAVQYQLAFLAGAIHVKPAEIQKAAAAEAGNPIPDDIETRVEGGIGWSDLEETITRFERGELDYEGLQDAEKAIIDAHRQAERR